MNDNQEYKIEDNESLFFDVLYNQFNLGFDNELSILGKHLIDDLGLQLLNIGKRIGLGFSPEEKQACLDYALAKKSENNIYAIEALRHLKNDVIEE